MGASPAVELVLRNGRVIDGTGTARRRADFGIAADRIVAPGFIDAHTHDDRALLSMPDLTPKVH